MAIKKYRPLSPDPYVNKLKGDTEFARLAHLNDLVNQVEAAIDVTAGASLPIEFSAEKIYGSATSPLSSNITASLTSAKLGVVQKIYHQNGVAPTFPSGWVKLGLTSYSTTSLNIIYAEWAGGTRVEYWITQ